MSSFWNGDFYFDSIHSSKYNVCVTDINDNNILKEYGSTTSIGVNKEMSLGETLYYSESEKSGSEIVLHLCRIDKSKWNIVDLMNVIGWLCRKDFKKFQSTDFINEGYNIVDYVKVISVKKFLTPSLEGYIEVTFGVFDGYSYIIPNNNFIMNPNETKVLVNYSNIEDTYKPKIKIINLGDETTVIKIKNSTFSNKELELSRMKNSEVITIDCKMGIVNGITELNSNRFSILNNFNFIELVKGNNTIVSSGNALVEFICEFPIII
ncbi:MAG: hypothetical protein RSD09_03535 [Bacilli bacterium]